MTIQFNAADLSSRFVLVGIKTKCFGNTRKEDGVSERAEIEAGAMVGSALKTGKFLLRPKTSDRPGFLDPVTTAKSAVLTAHKKMTSPWSESSTMRLLPTVKHEEYTKTINPLIREFERAVEELESQYDQEIEDSKVRLGNLFDPLLYPADFRAQFALKCFVETIDVKKTASGVMLPAEELEKIEKDMQAQLAESVARVQRENWARIVETVGALNASLRGLESGEQKRVKKTLLEQIELAVQEIPSFNVTGDSTLIEQLEEIKSELLAHDMEEIRKDETVRAQVTAKSAAIVDKAKARMEKMRDLNGYTG